MCRSSNIKKLEKLYQKHYGNLPSTNGNENYSKFLRLLTLIRLTEKIDDKIKKALKSKVTESRDV